MFEATFLLLADTELPGNDSAPRAGFKPQHRQACEDMIITLIFLTPLHVASSMS